MQVEGGRMESAQAVQVTIHTNTITSVPFLISFFVAGGYAEEAFLVDVLWQKV